jgi:hypothetical protein
VLIKKLSKDDVFSGKNLQSATCVLTFNGITIEFPKPDFIVKIIDFGYARMTIKNTVINNPDFSDFKGFRPFYDVAYFLNNIADAFNNSNPIPSRDIKGIISFIDYDKHYRPIDDFSEQSVQYNIIYDRLTALFVRTVPRQFIKPRLGSELYDISIK